MDDKPYVISMTNPEQIAIVEKWAKYNNMTRTKAIAKACFMAFEYELMKSENEILRHMIIPAEEQIKNTKGEFEVWGAFDEDDVLLDYSLSEEDVREWAYDRFEKEMVSIARMTIHQREQVKIRNLRDPYQEYIDE
jgi:adenylosuccinate lyase